MTSQHTIQSWIRPNWATPPTSCLSCLFQLALFFYHQSLPKMVEAKQTQNLTLITPRTAKTMTPVWGMAQVHVISFGTSSKSNCPQANPCLEQAAICRNKNAPKGDGYKPNASVNLRQKTYAMLSGQFWRACAAVWPGSGPQLGQMTQRDATQPRQRRQPQKLAREPEV